MEQSENTELLSNESSEEIVIKVEPICWYKEDASERQAPDVEIKIVSDKTEASSTTFLCNLCSGTFQKMDELDEHKKQHDKAKECTETDSALAKVSKQSSNTEVIKVNPLQCSYCNKIYSSKLNLWSHRRHHKKNIKCPQCDKMFVDNSNMNIHLRSHTGERLTDRRYICDKCGKSYLDSRYLKKHLTSHSDERPHVCNICEASFKLVGALYLHQQCHLETKSFRCDFCGKSFASRKYLGDHKRRIHTGLRKHECTFCDRTFNRKPHLKEHLVTHTKEKDYECDICFKTFTKISGLSRHKRTIHENGVGVVHPLGSDN